MKLIIEYSDEELGEARHNLDSYIYSSAIDDVWNYCRTKLKHGLYTPSGKQLLPPREPGNPELDWTPEPDKEIEISKEAHSYIYTILEEIQELVSESYNRGMGD